MAVNQITVLQVQEFFAHVLPATNDIKFLWISDGRRKKNLPFMDLKEMAIKALEYDSLGYDVYHANAVYTAPQYQDKAGRTKQRTKHNARAAKAFWLDIDCGGEKQYPSAEHGLDALLSFCEVCGLKSPTSIFSGGGIHVYWALNESVDKLNWLRVANRLKMLAHTASVRLYADDALTTNIASVLRPIMTHNQKPKYERPLVRVCNQGAEVSFSDFEAQIDKALHQLKVTGQHRVLDIESNSCPDVLNNTLAGAETHVFDDTPRNRAKLYHWLNQIDADCCYDRYIRVVWAILSTKWVDAETIAHKWCSSAPHRFEQVSFDLVTSSFTPDHPNPISVRTLAYLSGKEVDDEFTSF